MKNKIFKRKKITVIAISSVLIVAAVFVSVSIGYFHIDFKFEKTDIAMPLEKNNVSSGDGSESNPITPVKTPSVVTVAPRVLPWNENSEEFREYRHKIYTQTQDICLEYIKEYGQLTEIDYKFVKGSPNTLTYKLCGAEDGSEYLITINFADKSNPTVSYEKNK